jgi:hypothetical protein
VKRWRTLKVDDYGLGVHLLGKVPRTSEVVFYRDVTEGWNDTCLLDLKTGQFHGFGALLPRRTRRAIRESDYPCWSPDGQRVLFLGNRGYPWAGLYVLRLKDHRLRRFVTYKGAGQTAVTFIWAHDGSVWTTDGDQSILQLDPNTGKVSRRVRLAEDLDPHLLAETDRPGELLLFGIDLYRWNVSNATAPVKLAEGEWMEEASFSPGAEKQ